MDLYIRVNGLGEVVDIGRSLKAVRGDQDAVNIGYRHTWCVGQDKVFKRTISLPTIERVLIDAREHGIEHAQDAIEEFFGK